MRFIAHKRITMCNKQTYFAHSALMFCVSILKVPRGPSQYSTSASHRSPSAFTILPASSHHYHSIPHSTPLKICLFPGGPLRRSRVKPAFRRACFTVPLLQ